MTDCSGRPAVSKRCAQKRSFSEKPRGWTRSRGAAPGPRVSPRGATHQDARRLLSRRGRAGRWASFSPRPSSLMRASLLNRCASSHRLRSALTVTSSSSSEDGSACHRTRHIPTHGFTRTQSSPHQSAALDGLQSPPRSGRQQARPQKRNSLTWRRDPSQRPPLTASTWTRQHAG